MSKFKPQQFDIQKDGQAGAKTTVVKLDDGGAPQVQPFQFSQLIEQGKRGHSAPKAGHGAPAATDEGRRSKTRKDARFAINPLLRATLSIDEEERQAIEEKVRARVSAIADEVRTGARKEGYEEGLKRGHEEAFRKFREEGAERLRRLESFLAQCESAKQEIFQANERYLVELVYRIARMVLLRELRADRDYVRRLAAELIERVGARESVTLRVHPDELATAGMLKDGLVKSLGDLKNLNVEPSAQVREGGCMIETEWNAIDATVETQLRNIYDALVGDK